MLNDAVEIPWDPRECAAHLRSCRNCVATLHLGPEPPTLHGFRERDAERGISQAPMKNSNSFSVDHRKCTPLAPMINILRNATAGFAKLAQGSVSKSIFKTLGLNHTDQHSQSQYLILAPRHAEKGSRPRFFTCKETNLVLCLVYKSSTIVYHIL